MIMMDARILLSLLLVVVLFESSEAIECYNCGPDNLFCSERILIPAFVKTCEGYSCIKFTADDSSVGEYWHFLVFHCMGLSLNMPII